MNKFPCGGVIVFDPTLTQTILVETDAGYKSFPKGKLKKGEDLKTGALRELEEETGIHQNQIDIIPNIMLQEYSDKGKPSIQYFIGICQQPIQKFTFDIQELKNVQWVDMNRWNQVEKLKFVRRQLGLEAWQLVQNKNKK